ncbi:hypothetical protein [Pseudomonas sp. LP_7_YM]|uniref:hypothetical protein n=1 Tax=Pseudomonas sp. LP_7_YM TaxID=2485137 RepID=UPI0010601598|nr:hypothetical protein [Pseudomonas sp. LP_7_YM]TDV69943.1 hypothetical protein EC915_102204 [Pseudomonas sp. LP_7_YM]
MHENFVVGCKSSLTVLLFWGLSACVKKEVLPTPIAATVTGQTYKSTFVLGRTGNFRAALFFGKEREIIVLTAIRFELDEPGDCIEKGIPYHLQIQLSSSAQTLLKKEVMSNTVCLGEGVSGEEAYVYPAVQFKNGLRLAPGSYDVEVYVSGGGAP